MPHIACCIAPYRPDAGFSSASRRRPPPAGGRRPTPVDFVTRFCGLFQPTAFVRIRKASLPINTTPIRIASGPAERLDKRRGLMRARAGPVC
jgi:hypothetical protein